MIPITYNSQALYLLDDLPDWASPYKATASLITAQESGLTDREARRAHGETLRLRVAYQIKASGSAARLLAGSLRAHQNEPVCAPLWPAACAWSDRASADITGGLKAVFPAAGGTPRIYATGDAEPSSPTPSATDTLVPLVVGYLESRDLRWLTDTYATFDVTLEENSPNAWAINANASSALVLSPNSITARGENTASGEVVGNLFDGSAGTKWLDFSTTSWVRFSYTEPVVLSGYAITSANDAAPRDPKNWNILGSSDGVTWTVLDVRINQTWASRFQAISYVFANTVAYSFYKWEITANNGDVNTQAAGFLPSIARPYTAPAGPQPSGYASAPRLFPFLTHWDGPRTGYTLRIARDEIGFGRQTSDVARVAAVARTVEQTAWASVNDGWSAAKLLKFFLDHGAGASFWASGQQSAAVLAADLAAAATTATVTDTTGLVIGDRLGLVQKGQLTGWVGPLTGIANPTLSFVSSGNAASPAATTSLVPLLLARFDSPKLDLEWVTDRLAVASFRVRELPPELALPAGETLGTTLGNLTPRAWLYEFTKTFPGATAVSRYTSYERDLTFSGNTYTSKKLTHGDIKTGLALDRDELSIDCDGLEIPALLDVALLRSEVPLALTVSRAEITGAGTAGNATVAWSGEVSSAAIKAKRLTAKANSLGSAFDRKAPRFYLQPGCNHALFSVGCGLSAASFAHTATLTDVGTAGYPYTFTIGTIARAGGAVLTAADVFAGGWIEIGTGASLTRRAILASTAVSGLACVLTLSGDPSPFPSNGTAITIYPGCDGRKETCAATFGNYLNFGGAPFVPTGNPSLFKLSSDAGSGGKK